MDARRGRSPSVGRTNNLSHPPSPSPHGAYNTNVDGLSLDPSLVNNIQDTFSSAYNNEARSRNNVPYPISTAYPDDISRQTENQHLNAANQIFLQSQAFPHQPLSAQFGQQGNQHSANLLGLDNQFAQFENIGGQQLQQSIDPWLLVDPELLGIQQPQTISVNPAMLTKDMAMPPQQHAPTPPYLLPNGSYASQHSSPRLQQGVTPPRHSRHQSIEPPAVAYGQAQGGEWQGMQFVGHRRTPSDAYSDISSAQPSPNMNNNDGFDHVSNASPLLNAQSDTSMFHDALGLGHFTISDAQNQHRLSPGHSPHVSPRLSPQRLVQEFTPSHGYGMSPNLNQNTNYHFAGGIQPDVYQSREAVPHLYRGHSDSVDLGQADQMSPPEINIEFAPPARQPSFNPHNTGQEHALSPPDMARGRNRNRAKSDPFVTFGSRPSTPTRHPSSPPNGHDLTDTLSPNDIVQIKKSLSRSPSPSARSDRPSSRRSSTSSIPNRSYYLGLADPGRSSPSSSPGPGATGSSAASPASGGNNRVQRHPATFECHLCTKRFTRAYNLRSHLRTHTDERPFVCTVCGKAFARQHDRKRHEGLHSGEKKYVCRGELKGGAGVWGCGRRFARADALGRHFRSEAGRMCIKPLLEEERQERERAWLEQQAMINAQQQNDLNMQIQMQQQMQPLDLSALDPNSSNYTLPAALLAQYPEFAGLNWADFSNSQGDVDVDDGVDDASGEGGLSGRSSFDAGSGGEWGEGDAAGGSGGALYRNGVGTGYGGQSQGMDGGGGAPPVWNRNEWTSDYEGER